MLAEWTEFVRIEYPGIDLPINIQIVQEDEIDKALHEIQDHGWLACDTETVGIYSEEKFQEAHEFLTDLNHAKAYFDAKYEIWSLNYKGKRSPEAVAAREDRDRAERELNQLTKIHAGLISKAINDPNKGGLHFWENKLGCVQIGAMTNKEHLVWLFRNADQSFDPILNGVEMLLFQNAKFDWKMLKHHANIDLHCENLWDTQVIEYLLTNGTNQKLSLKELATKYSGIEMEKSKALRVNWWTGEWSEDMIVYAALDVVLPFIIQSKQAPEVMDRSIDSLVMTYNKLIPAVARMEMNGIAVDHAKIKPLQEEVETMRESAMMEAAESLGVDTKRPIDDIERTLNSPKQLKELLSQFIPGLTSTDKSVLEAHKFTCPQVAKLLEYRSLTKLLGTYIHPFIDRSVAQEDGHFRIYGSFNINDTRTSRLSCEDPNLQNIPARSDLGVKLRKCIVAPPGKCLIVGDLSAIEPRILADYSADPLLVRAFRNDLDPYKYIISIVDTMEYEDVTKTQRKMWKELVLGMMYDKSAFGLAKSLEISDTQARTIIKTLFDTLIYASDWIKAMKDKAFEDGYIELKTGFRRYLHDLMSDDPKKVAKAIREIINSYIQGLAAQCMHRSIILADKMCIGTEYKLILSVHDELVLEAPDTEEGRAIGKSIVALALLEGTMELVKGVPIRIGSEEDGFQPSVVYEWGEMKE